jgi:hypothetical protein
MSMADEFLPAWKRERVSAELGSTGLVKARE